MHKRTVYDGLMLKGKITASSQYVELRSWQTLKYMRKITNILRKQPNTDDTKNKKYQCWYEFRYKHKHSMILSFFCHLASHYHWV